MLSTTSPSLTTIALLLIIFFISLRLLDMLWRAFMFWIRLATRIVFWGSIAILGCWIWARGPEGVIEDIGGMMTTWRGELDKVNERVEYAKMFSSQMGNGAKAKREGQWDRKRGW
jgi:hypothetical protein